MAKDTATKATIVGRSVHLERLLRAPPERVWKAYATQEALEQWFWPTGQGKAKEFDFRPGGRLVMGHAEQPWVATWRFKEVVPERRIVFEDIWPDGSGHVATGTIEFQRVPEGTKLVVDFGPFPETGPYRLEDAVGGFGVTMDRLADLLEAMPSDREVLITREVDAPPERVWAAWTDPQQLARWYGPDGFRITTHAWDLRPGGVWRFTMHGPDGTDYPNWVRYTEITPPRRLAYDHGGSKADEADFQGLMTLEPLAGGRTRLTLRSVFPSKEARDHVVREYHAVEGGKQTLARLAEHLAGLPGKAQLTMPPGTREILIVRVFEAPRAQVWRAMTEPELLAKWWGRGNRLDVERYEFERGGHWRFVEHAPEGTGGFEGRFGDIVPPESVEMTFAWDGLPTHVMLNRMRLEELPGGRTRLVVVSLFMTEEDRDGMAASGMEEGMDQSYAALDKLLATMEDGGRRRSSSA